MRAAFREGVGCVILAPDQTFEAIDSLPTLDLPYPPGDPASIGWPDGDLITSNSLPAGVDGAALQAASDWAFDRESPEQVTLSLLVVHKGQIIHERYAPGMDMTTRTRTWSAAKSLAVTLFGMFYLQNGIWNGERLISQDWIDFVRTPAPATVGRGGQYGAQWWLVPEERNDVPKDAYAASGNRGQFVVVVPTHDLVIVRRGLDYGRQGFDRWALTREVIKAIGEPTSDGLPMR